MIGLISIGLSWGIIIMLFFHLIFPKFDKENPVAKTLSSIDFGSEIRGYKLFNPSFVFYFRHPIQKLNTKDELIEFTMNYPGGQIITRTEFEEDYDDIQNLEEVTRQKDIFENPTTIILRVKN